MTTHRQPGSRRCKKAVLHPGSAQPGDKQGPRCGLRFQRGATYGGRMDKRAEIRDFLATRRAQVTPEQAGLPSYTGTRRVPGLRREEVAHLAGVSVDYYTRLERGKTTSASPQVLDALARALQLDE